MYIYNLYINPLSYSVQWTNFCKAGQANVYLAKKTLCHAQIPYLYHQYNKTDYGLHLCRMLFFYLKIKLTLNVKFLFLRSQWQVIGGGVVGLAIARQLASRKTTDKTSTLLIERNKAVGLETSSRNSEVHIPEYLSP